MREYTYKVTFGGEDVNRYETVTTIDRDRAEILAQAEQIKKGNRYDDLVDCQRYGV